MRYGGYHEVLYLLSNGDVTKHNEIFKMSAHQCVHWGEYLLEKRRLEASSLKKQEYDEQY